MITYQLHRALMGRDELSSEYYDEDDDWMPECLDEPEPASEETLALLRSTFPRMSEEAKLRLVMALADLAGDDELIDLMGACHDESTGFETSDVEARAWDALRDGIASSMERRKDRTTNIEDLPEVIQMSIEMALMDEFGETVEILADELRTSDACKLLDAIADALESFPEMMDEETREAVTIQVGDLRDNSRNRSPRYAFM